MINRFVQFFARRPALTAVLWVGLVVFGTISYTALSPREGFPGVDVPITVSFGTYFVDDTEQVDRDVLVPLTEQVLAEPAVESVTTVARENSFTMIANLASGFTSAQGVEAVERGAAAAGLPDTVDLSARAIDAAKFLDKFDLLVGVYGEVDTTPAELEAAGATLIDTLEAEGDIELAEVVELIQTGVNPVTGEPVSQEGRFNQLSKGVGTETEILPSIAVGVISAEGADSLAIRDATDAALSNAASVLPAGFEAVVAIDQATNIRQQVGSLQSNVLTGIIAVAVVALLLISWRASIITALFIFTVLATTFGVLFLLGISINTISLFGVILALGLFVDDAIVITEAIDAFREGSDKPLAIIGNAINRVGSASVSGTITTVLVFAPMLAISGILGDFIRILPISVMVALIVSLVLSLIFIPFASRFLVLNAPPSAGVLARVEEKAAHFIASLPGTRGKAGVGIAAVGIGVSVLMTFVGLFVFAPNVGFNIFPPNKDSQFIAAEFAFEPGTSIEQAREIALDVNQKAADALGDELEFAYTWQGNANDALVQYRLTPLGGRPAAPDLVEDLLQPIGDSVQNARVVFSQVSNGPPEALFPFQLQVYGDDLPTMVAAGEQVVTELVAAPIERGNGSTFSVVETEVALMDTITRTDGRRYIEVRASFDADDVTTTTSQTQALVEDRFPAERLAELGLADDAFGFDFGFESDNQESFESMPIAFGFALLMMLLLLIIQFRSTVQWLLVFLAIPFSFFGVFGGLLLTNNQISFFVMLGLLGLIGIAVNNTILLTDFANQERRDGADRKQAIETAMRRRFRPLLATSLTTVAGVLPLALSDPFWEALGFTIIFGLLSSTFLVIVSFPYYYLMIEWLRDRIRTPWRSGRSGSGRSSEVPVEALV